MAEPRWAETLREAQQHHPRLHNAVRACSCQCAAFLSPWLRYYWHYTVTMPFLELRNIALVAEIIINSALRRTERRGVHVRIDCPEVTIDEDELPMVSPMLSGKPAPLGSQMAKLELSSGPTAAPQPCPSSSP